MWTLVPYILSLPWIVLDRMLRLLFRPVTPLHWTDSPTPWLSLGHGPESLNIGVSLGGESTLLGIRGSRSPKDGVDEVDPESFQQRYSRVTNTESKHRKGRYNGSCCNTYFSIRCKYEDFQNLNNKKIYFSSFTLMNTHLNGLNRLFSCSVGQFKLKV